MVRAEFRVGTTTVTENGVADPDGVVDSGMTRSVIGYAPPQCAPSATLALGLAANPALQSAVCASALSATAGGVTTDNRYTWSAWFAAVGGATSAVAIRSSAASNSSIDRLQVTFAASSRAAFPNL